ncbi:MAG: NAD(P)H-quinone oxidoreductase [Pseudomonadota bacterium]
MASALPTEMAVVEMREAGGPHVLVAGRRPLPDVADGEILVRVAAAGVNGPDLMQRRGLYPPPAGASDLLGLEVSGHVAALGSGVSDWAVGDPVCGLTNGGGYADYVAVDASHCLPIPDGVGLVDAAGLPETYFTVWSNVFMGAGLSAGQRLLVHGGAGGIGSTAIQLGNAFGADVIATESPAERCAFCRTLGADEVVDFREADFVTLVRAAGGADVILDIVGGDNIEKNIKAARHDAHIIQLAFNQGAKATVNFMPIMLKRLNLTGSTLRSRSDEFKTRVAQELRDQVWPKFAAGAVRPVTSKTFPLADAAAAHVCMEAATHQGKILLTVSDG